MKKKKTFSNIRHFVSFDFLPFRPFVIFVIRPFVNGPFVTIPKWVYFDQTSTCGNDGTDGDTQNKKRIFFLVTNNFNNR